MSVDAIDTKEPADGFEIGLSYLWHLEMIGLLDSPDWIRPKTERDRDLEALKDKAAECARKVLVCIIDNGMARSHPNIERARCATRIEFVQSPWGTVYPSESSDGRVPDWRKAGEFLDTVETKLRAGVSSELKAVFDELAMGMLNSRTETKVVDPSHRFGAHGTACAGLVAASAQKNSQDNPHWIEYSGVSPLCSVASVSTIYNHEYWPVIMGLLYAVAIEAQVILLPRSIEDMKDPDDCTSAAPLDLPQGPNADEDPRFTRLIIDRQRFAEKCLLTELIKRISKKIPLIVPAGNSSQEVLEFPSNIQGSSIIVVGARTAYGRLASYSGRGDAVTVYAPSDDREEVSETEYRVATASWRSMRLGSPPRRAGEMNHYCPYGVLSTDIPGQWGYAVAKGELQDYEAPSAAQRTTAVQKMPQYKPRSLYTIFGGTSAAASIVAGVVAQLQAWSCLEGGGWLSGAEVKKILEETAQVAPRMTEREGPVKENERSARDFIDAAQALKRVKDGASN